MPALPWPQGASSPSAIDIVLVNFEEEEGTTQTKGFSHSGKSFSGIFWNFIASVDGRETPAGSSTPAALNYQLLNSELS